jgi:capsular exopolysaccharide synthesis family protein
MKTSLRQSGNSGRVRDEFHDFDEEDPGANLRNAWLLVRERKWYILTVFLVTVLITAVYTFLSTPIYEAHATVQVLRHGPRIMRVADVTDDTIASDADFNTQINILDSATVIQNVVNRMSPEELKQLTDPYSKGSGETPPSPAAVIFAHRRIAPQRLSLITSIVFQHPNPKIAARVANLIAGEYIAYNSRIRIEEALKVVDELKDRADQQRKHVDEIANALQSFRQRGNLISLVQSKDIVTEKLKALNMMATQTNARLHDAEVRWNQVREWTKSGKPLTELSFIASDIKVSHLLQEITTQKLALADLRQYYKDKHPKLIEAVNAVAQAEREMKVTLDAAAESIKADYENALQTDAEARKALAEQEGRSLDMDKSAVEYENLERDFRVNDQLLESMIARMRETSVTSSMETENARVLDSASEPQIPISPKKIFNLVAGAFAGILLGIGVAYLIAMIEDRVKTTFDVEEYVGFPLLGVVPRVKRMEPADKAQIVSNGADPIITEAFLSLYSTMRVKDNSRNARLIGVTSTLPGEGKSFIATNLALTFAAQGQRTAIVDCDLRKPNVQRSFRLRMAKGVIDYCVNGAPFEDIVVKDVYPNLDVITSGGRATNPIHLINSKEFESLVTELSKRYDRVVFDTPPLAAVADALNILPLMDGAIYAIQFNRVMRKAAQRSARRLASGKISVFGAVLNDVKAGGSTDYYVDYNDKRVNEYYAHKATTAGAQRQAAVKMESTTAAVATTLRN